MARGHEGVGVDRVRMWRPDRAPWRRIMAAVAIVVAWQIAADLIDRPAKLASPLQIAQAFWPMLQSGEILGHAAASLRRVAVGFGLAVALAVPAGVGLGVVPRLRQWLDPIIEMLRPIPALAILPVLLLLFGVGEALNIGIVFYAAVFPILLSTIAGVFEVERVHREAALTLGAKSRQIVRAIVIPSALPTLFTGLRLGLQFSWMSIVGAELIGATSGLGFMILYYGKFLQMDRILVGMVVIGILGFLLDRILLITERLVLKWKQR